MVGFLLVLSAGFLTSACAVPGVTKSTAANSAPSNSSRPTVDRVPTIVPNIFARGTVSHTVTFGAQVLTIKYYTVGGPAWDGRAPVPVQFSAHVERSDGRHTLKISTFLSTFSAGSSTTTVGRDQGPFVITPPFSYGGVFTVPSTRAATGTVTNEFTLLVETAPKSGQFFRDTVIDTLKLDFAAQASATSAQASTASK